MRQSQKFCDTEKSKTETWLGARKRGEKKKARGCTKGNDQRHKKRKNKRAKSEWGGGKTPLDKLEQKKTKEKKQHSPVWVEKNRLISGVKEKKEIKKKKLRETVRGQTEGVIKPRQSR